MDFIWGETNDEKDVKQHELYRSHNEIWFSHLINNETINKLIKLVYEVIHDDKLSAYRENNDLEIILHIDSGGGIVSSAFKFIDFIQQLQKRNIKLRTIINGKACSAATLIALAGNKKQITKHSYAMIHELSSVTWGNYTQMKSYQRHLDTIHEFIVQLYLQQNNIYNKANDEEQAKHKDEIEKIMLKETWFTADEYKQKGFVDEII
jgi:ATP-dependent Clp protease, protease subunit